MLGKIYHSHLVHVSLLLSVGIGLLFWQTLLWGYVQVPADIPAFFDPTLRESAPDMVRPQNVLLSDHVQQFYVWHYLAAESMQNEGRIPLWNPHFLGGQPLLANAQPALYYPINWLLFWFDAGLVAAIRSMFNLFVAGFFTFLFGRALGISREGAILAAVAFTFSGALIVGPSHAYANCLVWLPLLMWAGEKALSEPERYTLWGLVASVGVGLSIVGGHPESSFHNLLVFVIYLGLRLLWQGGRWREKGRPLLAGVIAVTVGLLLGAVQWLPFVVWWSESATPTRSPSWNADSVFYARHWLAYLATTVTLLFPNFYGHPVDYTYQWPFPTFQNFLEQAMYIGLAPIALAAGALFYGEKRQRAAVVIIVLLALVLLAVALRLPGFEAFNHLPILDRVNNTRLKWYFAFLAAVAAGFGLDAFVAGVAQGRKRVFYPVTAVLSLALLMVLGIFVGKYLLPNIPANGFAHHLLFVIFSLKQTRTAVTLIVLSASLGGVLYAWYGRQVNLSGLKWLFIGLAFAELLVMAYGYNTTVAPETVFPPVRLTETLGQDEGVFRILAEPPAFWPNYGAVYGFYHVGGYDLPVHKRASELYLAQGGRGYRQIWSPEWPLVDWMNVKYIITTQAYDLPKLELILDNGYRVYRNHDVLPRAFMVYDVQVIPDDANLLATMIATPSLLATTAFLQQTLPLEQAQAITASATDRNTVAIAHYGFDEVVLTVTTETAGLLVMSDIYASGWQAQLNGRATALHRANYAYRSVFVPPGEHVVTFTYQPWDFEVGRALSLLGLLVVTMGLLWWVRQPKSRTLGETNR